MSIPYLFKRAGRKPQFRIAIRAELRAEFDGRSDIRERLPAHGIKAFCLERGAYWKREFDKRLGRATASQVPNRETLSAAEVEGLARYAYVRTLLRTRSGAPPTTRTSWNGP